MEYLVTGYQMESKVWQEAETEVIKQGFVKERRLYGHKGIY